MKEVSPERALNFVTQRLTEIRKSKGVSHEILAQKIGVHRSSISLIESGKRSPTLLTLLKIASGLGISLAQVIKEAEGKN